MEKLRAAAAMLRGSAAEDQGAAARTSDVSRAAARPDYNRLFDATQEDEEEEEAYADDEGAFGGTSGIESGLDGEAGGVGDRLDEDTDDGNDNRSQSSSSHSLSSRSSWEVPSEASSRRNPDPALRPALGLQPLPRRRLHPPSESDDDEDEDEDAVLPQRPSETDLAEERTSDTDVDAGDEANEENLNSLENFLNDDSNVSPTSRFTYVIMLAESIRTDGVELKSIEPYSLLVAKKKTGWGERKFSANKDMYAMEIKRRDPTAKINKKSKSIKALREMLRALPLSAADRQFVEKEEAQARECVEEMLGPDDENGGSGIITETDKLRYIVLFCSDEVRAAYLRAQRVLEGGPNGELSLRNHAERQPEWYELLVVLFNDVDQEAQTVILSTLHSKFTEVIQCPKGDYDLTEEKAKKLLDTMKHQLRLIIDRYNMSGNGSDMRVLNDVDSDCEEVEELEKSGLDNRSRMSEETYGRFNKARAIARATKIGDDDLVMMDGDDRQSFLQGQPVSLLYWWHMFDHHSLLFRTVAILDANTGVSSDTRPRRVARRRGKRSRDSSSPDANATDPRLIRSSEALAQGVKDSVASINRLTQAQLLSQQTNLERERYTVELQKFAPHFAGNPAAIASIERRIAQIDSQLAEVAKLLHPESNEGNST